jgi:hypothetical protein
MISTTTETCTRRSLVPSNPGGSQDRQQDSDGTLALPSQTRGSQGDRMKHQYSLGLLDQLMRELPEPVSPQEVHRLASGVGRGR